MEFTLAGSTEAKSDYYSLTSYEEAYKLSNTAIGLTKGALYALLGIIGVIGIHTYSIPFTELIGMTVVLLLLQMVFSGFMSRYLQKDPLIERVRYQE